MYFLRLLDLCCIISLTAAFLFTFQVFLFFFFNATATTEIYTLSLHDALPIFAGRLGAAALDVGGVPAARLARQGYPLRDERPARDRKSTRLNSSHVAISYAVFCLKKKKQTNHTSHVLMTYRTQLRDRYSMVWQ